MDKTYVVGTLRDACTLRKMAPGVPLDRYEDVLQGRSFTRWYRRHRKVVPALAVTVPAFAMQLFGVSPSFLLGLLPPIAIPAAAGATFFSGHGVILLHMLIIGFLTLVVTTFMKFTGRGDLVPLIAFVGGGVILYECMQLFNDIYKGVEAFFSM